MDIMCTLYVERRRPGPPAVSLSGEPSSGNRSRHGQEGVQTRFVQF